MILFQCNISLIPPLSKSFSVLFFKYLNTYCKFKIFCFFKQLYLNVCFIKGCMHGKIELPPPPVLPQVLLDLLFGEDGVSINFNENIRAYNSMFAFTSMGGEIDNSVNNGRGPFVFRLHGQNFHQIVSLLPAEGMPPAFAQLYIFDTENEVTNRISAFRYKVNILLAYI